MVEEPSHVKQLSLNHVCKIGLNDINVVLCYVLSQFQFLVCIFKFYAILSAGQSHLFCKILYLILNCLLIFQVSFEDVNDLHTILIKKFSQIHGFFNTNGSELQQHLEFPNRWLCPFTKCGNRLFLGGGGGRAIRSLPLYGSTSKSTLITSCMTQTGGQIGENIIAVKRGLYSQFNNFQEAPQVNHGGMVAMIKKKPRENFCVHFQTLCYTE